MKSPPKQHNDIRCIRCAMYLELPELKRICTETWYADFGICDECKEELLSMANPEMAIMIDGEVLKTLLQTKKDQTLVATVFGE